MVSVVSRLALGLAGSVTLVSVALVTLALRSEGGYADARALTLGWVVVPAVGVAAYLGLRWGLAAALGALAAPALAAVVEGSRPSWTPVVVALGTLTVAVVVGHLARLAERHERG